MRVVWEYLYDGVRGTLYSNNEPVKEIFIKGVKQMDEQTQAMAERLLSMVHGLEVA